MRFGSRPQNGLENCSGDVHGLLFLNVSFYGANHTHFHFSRQRCHRGAVCFSLFSNLSFYALWAKCQIALGDSTAQAALWRPTQRSDKLLPMGAPFKSLACTATGAIWSRLARNASGPILSVEQRFLGWWGEHSAKDPTCLLFADTWWLAERWVFVLNFVSPGTGRHFVLWGQRQRSRGVPTKRSTIHDVLCPCFTLHLPSTRSVLLCLHLRWWRHWAHSAHIRWPLFTSIAAMKLLKAAMSGVDCATESAATSEVITSNKNWTMALQASSFNCPVWAWNDLRDLKALRSASVQLLIVVVSSAVDRRTAMSLRVSDAEGPRPDLVSSAAVASMSLIDSEAVMSSAVDELTRCFAALVAELIACLIEICFCLLRQRRRDECDPSIHTTQVGNQYDHWYHEQHCDADMCGKEQRVVQDMRHSHWLRHDVTDACGLA